MSPPYSTSEQILDISRHDRWPLYQRLQEVGICCSCPADGSLRVSIQHSLDLILLRSILHHWQSSRGELIQWLERCWLTQIR